MTFDAMEARYGRLREQLAAGELDQAGFKAAVQTLSVRDAEGRYWGMAPGSGQWHVWEDGAWKRAEPPRSDERPEETCPRCGQPVQAGSSFCGHCGQPLTAPGSEAAPEAVPQQATAAPPSSGQTPPTVAASPSSARRQDEDVDAPRPAAAAPPPPPPPPPSASAKGGPRVPMALVIAGAVVLCLLVAAGGAFVVLRGRAGASFLPQASSPTVTPAPTQVASTPTAQAAVPTETPSPSGLEPLAGVWQHTADGWLLQFSFAPELEGRLRLLPHFQCQVKGYDEERYYLELERIGEGAWEGFSVVDYYDPDADETEEWERSPMEVSLSSDGRSMTWTSPEENDSITWERATTDETVVLEIVNSMTDDWVDVWEIRMSDNEDPDRLDADVDRLNDILFAGDACEMILPPGTYNFTALDDNDEVVASKEGMVMGQSPTWVITGDG